MTLKTPWVSDALETAVDEFRVRDSLPPGALPPSTVYAFPFPPTNSERMHCDKGLVTLLRRYCNRYIGQVPRGQKQRRIFKDDRSRRIKSLNRNQWDKYGAVTADDWREERIYPNNWWNRQPKRWNRRPWDGCKGPGNRAHKWRQNGYALVIRCNLLNFKCGDTGGTKKELLLPDSAGQDGPEIQIFILSRPRRRILPTRPKRSQKNSNCTPNVSSAPRYSSFTRRSSFRAPSTNKIHGRLLGVHYWPQM